MRNATMFTPENGSVETTYKEGITQAPHDENSPLGITSETPLPFLPSEDMITQNGVDVKTESVKEDCVPLVPLGDVHSTVTFNRR